MSNNNKYDVVIVGGSYAGLSAAMGLGRALRNVLVIDSGNPCNKQTPHSHNFITQDGETPAEISRKAREQVAKYPTVHFMQDEVRSVSGQNNDFEVKTKSWETIQTAKILFATGVKDILPSIPGFSECWGISVIHCPYCHGYEYKNEPTAILSNGPMAYEYAKLIHNWTDQLVIFTNGKSEIDENQTERLKAKGIEIFESEISEIIHENGQLQFLVLKDGSIHRPKALYHRPKFVQHCKIPQEMGCNMTELGHIAAEESVKTSVPGIYAAGDNTTPKRSVSAAVAAGSVAAAFLNHELIDERF